jgi:transcriptional regulator with XRE-family HTH domain
MYDPPIMHSTEDLRPARIKAALLALGITQARAARRTRQSPALVSMVLNGRVRSAPCLRRLRRLIARELRRTVRAS